jgi:hypothetical protein
MINDVPAPVMIRALQILLSRKGRSCELWLYYSAGSRGEDHFPFVLDDHRDLSRTGFKVPGTFSWLDRVRDIHNAIALTASEVVDSSGLRTA